MFNQETSSSSIYSLPHKARCLAAQISRDDRSRFLAGTLSLKEENEIYLLEVQEDEEIQRIGIFSHPPEIWGLSPSPTDESLLFTTYSVPKEGGYKNQASLWKMDESDNKLEEVLKLNEGSETTRCVSWESGGNAAIAVDDHVVRYYKLTEDNTVAKAESEMTVGEKNKLSYGCFDPHFENQIATIGDTSIRGWDLRTAKQTFLIENAHGQQVRDIDFNRNRAYYFVTAGDDCKVKFWDSRKVDAPVKEMAMHSHWVWNVKYNPSYDQLVISSSTDCSVNLYNMISISFASLSETITADEDGVIGDARKSVKEDSFIKKFEEHEDSIYSIAWSAHNAWTFASLSYDGRIAINYVPEDEKYKILFS